MLAEVQHRARQGVRHDERDRKLGLGVPLHPGLETPGAKKRGGSFGVRAVGFFSTLEASPLPKSRYEVVVELAGELLGPPITPEDLAKAVRVTSVAGSLPGGDARLAVARLRIAAAAGPRADARALATRIDPSRLDVHWRLLVLESRAGFADRVGDASEIAREAETISPAQILVLPEEQRADARARRGALMLFGGRVDAIPAADRDSSLEMAANEGWSNAVPPGVW